MAETGISVSFKFLLWIQQNGDRISASNGAINFGSLGTDVIINFSCEGTSYSAIYGKNARHSANENSICISNPQTMLIISFDQISDHSTAYIFIDSVFSVSRVKQISHFDMRTEEYCSQKYFEFYSYLYQQQNMLQDFTRTSTYQKAFLKNPLDFSGKVVLDVGAGTGILSFFAIQAGARKVYAVEASSMSQNAETLVKNNGLQDKIIVINSKIEDINLPEKVDIIISEPLGYMLVNERMLESYVHAKKFFNPYSVGMMFPTFSDLYVAPFTDDVLFTEIIQKCSFWNQSSFFGVNLNSLEQKAFDEQFNQPIIDLIDYRTIIARPIFKRFNYTVIDENDLHVIQMPLDFHITSSGVLHGLAFWFDSAFVGSTETVWLSTAPSQPSTHWYQVRILFQSPLFVRIKQTIMGTLKMIANKKQSYDVEIEIWLKNDPSRKSIARVDLKNPFFRYPTSSVPIVNVGLNSPTELFYDTQQMGRYVDPSTRSAANYVPQQNQTETHTAETLCNLSALETVGTSSTEYDVNLSGRNVRP